MVTRELLRRYGALARENVILTPIGGLAVGKKFYLKENGEKKQFVVVGHNVYSSGCTLVMRRYAIFGTSFNRNGNNNYDGSTLDTLLQTTYRNKLPTAVQSATVNALIDVIAGNGSYTTKKISRAIFVFSLTELNTPQSNINVGSGIIKLGNAIPYFDTFGSYIYQEGATQTSSIWTRTPYYIYNGSHDKQYNNDGRYAFFGSVTNQVSYCPAFNLRDTFGVELV